MILTDLKTITAYRMHSPKWAVWPTSGAGAAKHGGRANRPGLPALYLALDADTAVKIGKNSGLIKGSNPQAGLLETERLNQKLKEYYSNPLKTQPEPIW